MTDQDKIDELSEQTLLRLMANCVIMLTIIGAVLSRMDLIDMHSTVMGLLLGLSVVALIYLAGQRATSLPFLGPSVVPRSLLKPATSPPMADIEIDVEVDARASHVAYWAADPSGAPTDTTMYTPHHGPRKAYTQFRNSGISPVTNGTALLRLRCPGEYAVRGKILPKHVHYREVYPGGIMGEMKKANVLCS